MVEWISEEYKKQKEQFFGYFMNFEHTNDKETGDNVEQGVYNRLWWILDHSDLEGAQELSDTLKLIKTKDELEAFKEALLIGRCMDDKAVCLECGKKFMQDRDIQLCDDCVDLFDLDRLWKLHDENKIDALDFNEQKSVREQFRKVKNEKKGKIDMDNGELI